MNQLTRKQQRWLEIVQDWQTSGVNQAEYCRRHQLSLKQFYNWKYLFTKQQVIESGIAQSSFTPITVAASHIKSAIVLNIAGVEVKYDDDTDPDLLLQLLNLLRGHHDQAEQ